MMQIKQIKVIDGHEHYSITSDGEVIRTKTGRILKQSNMNGYRQVTLSCDGKRKEVLVHQLLAKAFIPNPHRYPKVDHIDRNRSNNNLTNLRWVSNKQNSRNISKQLGTSSRFIGVCQRKGSKMFTAQITINGKQTHLNSYKTEIEAAIGYNEKAMELGYLNLNIIP
ncbi:HNH endonuclease signature motif containing protein [Hymenobacter armeniacus]|uniref:HNH endonuclease n=1 Tax=Hymenobacter armeniacus TaxID=2771358 RepID=A0ABR8JLE7_9BACT|nr:HNH endonuclease signature motif containing protein [Hymenobacter armeniacus]MBD2720816.1 HNH endonuclease [Hymenobacter armeniacus]